MGCSPHRAAVLPAADSFPPEPLPSRQRFNFTTKDSPSADQKRPSRKAPGRDLTIGMKSSIRQVAKRVRGINGQPLHITGLAKVLAGVLSLLLLCASIPAASPAVAAGQSVALTWDPTPDMSVAGYNIYYGISSGVYDNIFNVGNVTSATISSLVAGVTYYFAATAYYADGTESAFSNEISRTMPAAIPALQIRRASAGQFLLTVNGPAGHTYQILATTDLVAWTLIGTVTVGTGGSLEFTDTNAASYPVRFYRTQEVL